MASLLEYGLLAVGVAVGLFLLAAWLLPAGEQIAPAIRDDPLWRLPADQRLDIEQVEQVRLPVALRGYRFAETDLLLDRLGEELRERDAEIARLRAELEARQRQQLPGEAEPTGETTAEPPAEPGGAAPGDPGASTTADPGADPSAPAETAAAPADETGPADENGPAAGGGPVAEASPVAGTEPAVGANGKRSTADGSRSGALSGGTSGRGKPRTPRPRPTTSA